MKKWNISTTSLVFSIAFAAVAGPASASPAASVPHTFNAGGTIKASEMNDNFTALADAVNDMSLTPGPQGPAGADGAQGPAGAAGITINAAGTYVGQVGLGELGNFSLLPGAGGATGTAAADAACAAVFPGSRAEFDVLVLWKAAVSGVLPPPAPAFAYWASTVTEFPVASSSGILPRTTDCDDWTNNSAGDGAYVSPGNNLARIDVQVSTQACFADNMAVACFITP